MKSITTTIVLPYDSVSLWHDTQSTLFAMYEWIEYFARVCVCWCHNRWDKRIDLFSLVYSVIWRHPCPVNQCDVIKMCKICTHRFLKSCVLETFSCILDIRWFINECIDFLGYFILFSCEVRGGISYWYQIKPGGF